MKTGLPYTWKDPKLSFSEQGMDSSDSIPLGNGDVGINLWVEKDGDLFFYISKTDALSEHNQLLKLGRLRVSLTPNPFLREHDFELSLDISRGLAQVKSLSGGVVFEVWVNAHADSIHVSMKSEIPREVAVKLENWRQYPRTIFAQMESPWDFLENSAVMNLNNDQDRFVIHPDFFMDEEDALLWGHQNPEKTFWDDCIDKTWMNDYRAMIPNPLAYRISGCHVSGIDLIRHDRFTLKSALEVFSTEITVQLCSKQIKERSVWRDEIVEQSQKKLSYERAKLDHEGFWLKQAQKHKIQISGSAEAEHVSMCYALQRYMNLCASRGLGPIHFNGSIFTVDWKVEHANGKHESYNADYRRWGNNNLVQNTRWAYWTMLQSGDFEDMMSLFQVFIDSLESARQRCIHYYGIDGIYYLDSFSIWGTIAGISGMDAFGCKEDFLEKSWSANYLSAFLEVLMMALDYVEFSGDRRLLSELIEPATVLYARFFLKRFPLDECGKLKLKGSSLEHFHETENPSPDIAGLQVVMSRLLAMKVLSEEDQAVVEELLEKLPPLPIGRVEDEYEILQDRIEQRWKPLGLPLDRPPKVGAPDDPVLAPAEKVMSGGWNVENPELYAIFPYRMHCLANGDLELAKRSFSNRVFHHDWGWAQDPIQAAMVGEAEDAKQRVLRRYQQKFEKASFPVFWTANFDWIPDQDNGGVANKALQSLLMQYHEDRILLFCAWPREWKVNCRIFAPRETVIECRYENGVIFDLEVSPGHRMKDIEIPEDIVVESRNAGS